MARFFNSCVVFLATGLLFAGIAMAEDVEFWARSVTATSVDKQREDLPIPEWIDTEAILGAPDGQCGRLVLHNGWNDYGDITLDLGTEIPWGELVLVHQQRGPGAAKATTISVAPASGEFVQLAPAPITETLTTTVLSCDTPIRFIQISAGAGGGVPVDSTWYFDAVGLRTGRAAVARTQAIADRANALADRLAKLETPRSPEGKALLESARQRVQEQQAALAKVGDLPIGEIRPALERVGAALDQLDSLAMRLVAADLYPGSDGDNLPAYIATWMPGMAKVRPADPLRAADLRGRATISLARNEYESIQLALGAGDAPLEHVAFEVAPLKHVSGEHVIPAADIRLDRLDIVRVDGALWPDPILPLGDLTVPAGAQQSLRLQVYAPPDTPAGLYRTKVNVKPTNAHPLSLDLEVCLYDFEIPVIAHTQHIIGCGGGGVDPVLFANRTPTGGGPAVGSIAEPKYILRKDGAIAMDFTEYDKVMAKAFEAGLAAFGLPLSAGDGSGYMPGRMTHTFFNEATGAEEAIALDPLASDLAKQRLTAWLQVFTAHLREKGWFDRAVFYLWDEPNAQYSDTLLAVGRAVKAAVPDLPILVVESPHAPWDEVVDIYCPQVKWFGRPDVEKALADLYARGKKMWWYNCGDSAPFPNYSIPRDSACARMSFLLMWKYGLTGNLYWAASTKAIPEHGLAENPGADGRGDGQLAYACAAGVAPSLRLEMIRDGVEDYEYLWLLNERVGQAKARGAEVAAYEPLLTMPPEVATDAQHYTHDPAVLEAYRAKVAQAIEALRAK